MRKLAVLVVAALLLGACTTGTQSTAGSDRVAITTMSEFAFDLDPDTLPAGQEVTVVLTDDGDIRHEFMAGRDPMPDDGGYMQDLLADVDPAVTHRTPSSWTPTTPRGVHGAGRARRDGRGHVHAAHRPGRRLGGRLLRTGPLRRGDAGRPSP